MVNDFACRPYQLGLKPNPEVANSAQLDNPNAWAPAVSRITLLHQSIVDYARLSLDNAITIGEILSGIKDTLKHGEWLPWIEQYAPFAERTARNYIKVFVNRVALKSASVADLGAAYSFLLSNGSENGRDQPQQLHEPNFHSQAVRLRQNLVGLFTHYLQRRPLKVWQTEEIYDLLCSLKSVKDICAQLELELGTRDDLPAAYRQENGN